ncbi:MAG TPA: tetratricopeptide repeat protein [Oculatellaceae cyanobacterium]
MKPTNLLLPILLTLTIVCAPVLADDKVEGQKLYNQGKYVEASAYFNRAVETNNYDANAHYLLGNCYLAEKSYAKASLEYQRALEFTDDSKMEDYCRRALEKLRPYTEPKPQAASRQGLPKQFNIPGADAKEARVRDIIGRAQAQADELRKRAEELCKPIEEEKQATLKTMRIMYRGRVETTTQEERTETTNEYDKRLSAIRSDAKRQGDYIIEQARHEANLVGQGLPNLDQLLGR